MGSTFRMPIWAGATNAEAIDWARSSGVSIVGASAAALTVVTPTLDWADPRISLLMGSEAHGIDVRH